MWRQVFRWGASIHWSGLEALLRHEWCKWRGFPNIFSKHILCWAEGKLTERQTTALLIPSLNKWLFYQRYIAWTLLITWSKFLYLIIVDCFLNHHVTLSLYCKLCTLDSNSQKTIYFLWLRFLCIRKVLNREDHGHLPGWGLFLCCSALGKSDIFPLRGFSTLTL